jgi:hypothetical protein
VTDTKNGLPTDTINLFCISEGFGSGYCHRDEDDRDRQQNYGNMNSGGNSGNTGDQRSFNPRRNVQLRYNPGHDRGCAYGGYAWGWQRQQHPGYCFSGLRINLDCARAEQLHVNAQHVQTTVRLRHSVRNANQQLKTAMVLNRLNKNRQHQRCLTLRRLPKLR